MHRESASITFDTNTSILGANTDDYRTSGPIGNTETYNSHDCDP